MGQNLILWMRFWFSVVKLYRVVQPILVLGHSESGDWCYLEENLAGCQASGIGL